MRLGGEAGAEMRAPPAAANAASADVRRRADIVAHVQRAGDVPGKIGEWVGTRGSRQWIEGFSLAPRDGVKPADIEYQAVLGRGWLSPWIEGGKFCGSRGMALPLLGLKVRLKGEAAKTHECSYSATFVDGSSVGPVPAGETCEAESLAALEAFQVVDPPPDTRGGTQRRTRAPEPARRGQARAAANPAHRESRRRGDRAEPTPAHVDPPVKVAA